jgi:FAD/FMN-containing dehydrogenase
MWKFLRRPCAARRQDRRQHRIPRHPPLRRNPHDRRPHQRGRTRRHHRRGRPRGEIYAGLRRLRDTYAGLVRERFPDIPRRVSGYNLDQLLPENGFNVARALVGSEGTCVTILEATCELKPSPQHRRLVALGFDDAFIAADHVPAVLAFKPIGLEGFDGLLVDFMLRKNLLVDDVKLLPPGAASCSASLAPTLPPTPTAWRTRSSKRAKLRSPTSLRRPLLSRAGRARLAGPRVRLGACVFVPGEKNGCEGWEDSAVPPDLLGAYLRDLFALIERYGYRTPMYGHFGQGCVHLRITFDFKTAEGVANYRRFIDEAADIVLKYGGSFSGEHGDGQARAALLPKMFGPELMQAFASSKRSGTPPTA